MTQVNIGELKIDGNRKRMSNDNPRGYSKSQNKLFNALVMIHNKPNNVNNVRLNTSSGSGEDPSPLNAAMVKVAVVLPF